MYLTPSMISGYLYCKRKLYLQKVLGLKEPDNLSMIKGTIRHESYDLINKKDKEIVCSIMPGSDQKNIFSLYFNHYSKALKDSILKNSSRLKSFNITLIQAYEDILPFFKNQSTLRSSYLYSFIQKHEVYEKELWSILVPKLRSEYKISSEKLMLRGIIDQIEVYPKGLVPIELKTGSCPKQGVWPNHKIQLACYALLMEDHFNINLQEGFVVYLDTFDRRHVPINPFLRQEVKDLSKDIRIMLSSTKVPNMCKNKNKCRSCRLKDKCESIS